MTDGSSRGCGQDGEEPEGFSPFPAGGHESHDAGPGSGDGRDGPGEEGCGEWWAPEDGAGEQGLFWCVPAGAPDLAGFAGEAGVPAIAPGPLLAGLTSAVAGGDGGGLAGVSEDFLFAVMSAGRRMVSWGTWLELSAMRELALRHPAAPGRPARRSRPGTGPTEPAATEPAGSEPAATEPAATEPAGPGSAGAEPEDGKAAAGKPDADGRVQLSEFAADEVAAGLRLTWTAAADRILYACDLAGRLPATFAALGAGLLDPVHARIIFEQTDYLSAADAAKADAVLAAAAQHKTYGELRAAAVKLALKLDPESAERRKQARRKNDAHVRPFREDSGNAGMTARELPSDEVLASWQHVEQRAQDLQAAGVPGSLRELRWRAFLDLLQERDSRDTLPSPQGAGPPRAGSPGPSLAALVNITVPLATAFGESGTPGEAAGFGIMDAGTARDVIAAAGRDPRTRWCVTVLHPDGTAAAHGCATGQHQPPGPAPPDPEPPGPEPPGPEPPGPEPPGPEPPGPEPHPPPGAANLGAAGHTRGGPDQRPPPGTRAQDYLRSLRVTLAPIARGTCDHRHAEVGYQPSRKLRHLIRARSTRCSAPGCGRSAARCDLDHTVAWDAGGITCECGLAPLCRHHHRCKQAEGWQLAQPEPGVLQWRTPNGHTHTTTPSEYAI